MASLNAGRGRGRGRRAVSEINVVPYIDVMLVLLVIFMVTAPLVPPGQIKLASAGKADTAPQRYIELEIAANGTMQLRTVNTGDNIKRPVVRAELASAVKQLAASLKDQRDGDASVPVAISADKSVPYEKVIDAMGELKKQNIERIALLVKPSP